MPCREDNIILATHIETGASFDPISYTDLLGTVRP